MPAPVARVDDCEGSAAVVWELRHMSAIGVRRDKVALSSGYKPHPAIRSSRKLCRLLHVGLDLEALRNLVTRKLVILPASTGKLVKRDTRP